MKNNETCLIVSGGFADISFLKEYLGRFMFRYIIAADSGLETVRALSLSPTHLVGDFDSVDASVLNECLQGSEVSVERLVPEKDDTDTEHAVNMAVNLGCKTIILAGSTGTRLDHTIANIHVLYKAFQRGIEAWMIDSHNRIQLISGKTEIRKKDLFGTYISLFPFSGEIKGITLKGFKYPLNHRDLNALTCFGLCVSNELKDETGIITIEDGIMIYLETRD